MLEAREQTDLTCKNTTEQLHKSTSFLTACSEEERGDLVLVYSVSIYTLYTKTKWHLEPCRRNKMGLMQESFT